MSNNPTIEEKLAGMLAYEQSFLAARLTWLSRYTESPKDIRHRPIWIAEAANILRSAGITDAGAGSEGELIGRLKEVVKALESLKLSAKHSAQIVPSELMRTMEIMRMDSFGEAIRMLAPLLAPNPPETSPADCEPKRSTYKCSVSNKCDNCGQSLMQHENQIYCPPRIGSAGEGGEAMQSDFAWVKEHFEDEYSLYIANIGLTGPVMDCHEKEARDWSIRSVVSELEERGDASAANLAKLRTRLKVMRGKYLHKNALGPAITIGTVLSEINSIFGKEAEKENHS